MQLYNHEGFILIDASIGESWLLCDKSVKITGRYSHLRFIVQEENTMKKMVAKMMMAMVTMGLVFGHVSVTSYAAEESKEEISVDWEEEEEETEQPETEQIGRAHV